MIDLLHRLTHKVPGVPAHREGQSRPGHSHGHHHGHQHGHNHGPGRPPRVLVGWQRRIAELLGRPLP